MPLATFTPLTDLLYTRLVPASMSYDNISFYVSLTGGRCTRHHRTLSPSTQRSYTLAPSTQNSTSFLIVLCTISPAAYVMHQHPEQQSANSIKMRDVQLDGNRKLQMFDYLIFCQIISRNAGGGWFGGLFDAHRRL